MNTQTRIPLIGLVVVQIAIGYEWTISGLTKLVRGGFPAGLADELRDKSAGAPNWYRGFLDGAVIPHGAIWGYLIEFGELAVGLVLIMTALIWLFRWQHVRPVGREAIFLLVAAAAVAATAMNISFHLANGSPHPWLIPTSGFDEGVDLDSLMPAIQLVFAAVNVKLWAALHHERRLGTPGAAAQPTALGEV